MSSNQDLINEIEALSRQMMASAYNTSGLAQSAQREADRYQEIANIVSSLGRHQSEAGARLAELAEGADDFKLPQVFAQQEAAQHRQ